MGKVATAVRGVALRVLNRGKFEKQFLHEAPQALRPAAKFLYYRLFTSEERKLANEIESFRPTIKSLVDGTEVASYSSPHSGTFKKDDRGHSQIDSYGSSGVEAAAQTGASKRNGILLRRLIAGTGVKRILELGTNTGFSGAYFVSVPDVELVTVEGSESLCEIAEKNIERFSSKFRVMNMLFDEAIDQLIEKGERFDCVFVDGQHEKEATLHYAERVKPLMEANAVYLFDDIYWSEGMNEAWRELCQQPGFSVTVDLLYKGVCFASDAPTSRVHHDLGNVLPRPRIFRKGW
jgi:predicted O-methyltransferase YrrM